jgi:uncharacterized protein YcfL
MKLQTLLALGVVALAGCQNVNTIERASPNATPSYVADKRVITDSTLAGSLRVLSVNQAMVSGDHLKIQIQVENMNSSTFSFRYRVEWVDQQGMLLSSPTDLWKPYTLQGRETSSISAVATSPKAVDFVVKFQEVN